MTNLCKFKVDDGSDTPLRSGEILAWLNSGEKLGDYSRARPVAIVADEEPDSDGLLVLHEVPTSRVRLLP